MFLTPNGRFDVGKKICLSITGFHPESWQPAWGIRTALIAIISFFSTPGEGAVGALDWSTEARRKCADESLNWTCSVCKSVNATALPNEDEVPSKIFEVNPEISYTVKTIENSESKSLDGLDKSNTDPVDTAIASEPESVGKSDETLRENRSSSYNSLNQEQQVIFNRMWNIDLLILSLLVFIIGYSLKLY
jgi:ubiquitin-conjugating enzyme E2 J1